MIQLPHCMQNNVDIYIYIYYIHIMNMLIFPKYARSFHIFPPGQHNNWSTFVCCLWRHGMVSNVESAQIFYVWSYQWQGCQLISRQIHLNAPELLDLWLCFFCGSGVLRWEILLFFAEKSLLSPRNNNYTSSVFNMLYSLIIKKP